MWTPGWPRDDGAALGRCVRVGNWEARGSRCARSSTCAEIANAQNEVTGRRHRSPRLCVHKVAGVSAGESACGHFCRRSTRGLEGRQQAAGECRAAPVVGAFFKRVCSGHTFGALAILVVLPPGKKPSRAQLCARSVPVTAIRLPPGSTESAQGDVGDIWGG